ncbi:unnamed protein product [Paramecium sonneborni]|uniref:Uncharacterized protein n=1 Tax=Paramecium sonneborni TaxID=65129 RepID=A0A8S1RS75_9CILI|nr:unnamed protein product [Paramecium sonneborni]
MQLMKNVQLLKRLYGEQQWIQQLIHTFDDDLMIATTILKKQIILHYKNDWKLQKLYFNSQQRCLKNQIIVWLSTVVFNI